MTYSENFWIWIRHENSISNIDGTRKFEPNADIEQYSLVPLSLETRYDRGGKIYGLWDHSADCTQCILLTEHSLLYILNSVTLLTTHSTMRTLHYTHRIDLHCLLHTLYWTIYTGDCKLYSVNFPLQPVHWTQFTVHTQQIDTAYWTLQWQYIH